ncbi:MAG: UDP-N-acetylmuramate dehydrogenase [Acidobacteriota bacterium]
MATRTLEQRLRDAGFRGELRPDEPLARHTTYQIGGPAELLATPRDRNDLLGCLAWARAAGVPYRLLGNGSNLLVHDLGVPGVVIRLRKVLDDITREGESLLCGAGASFPAVANQATEAGLAGLEFATGIPGTVGGAIVMNAGWHEHETGAVVDWVEAVDVEGRVTTYSAAECAFGYRTSRFRRTREIILAARFTLRPQDSSAIGATVSAFAAARKANQPTAVPSCGSVYLKPDGDFAGRLIEAAGLKGRRHGGIEVSRLHANFFINRGGGTCADVQALMEEVETAVREQSGVRLEREVECWE